MTVRLPRQIHSVITGGEEFDGDVLYLLMLATSGLTVPQKLGQCLKQITPINTNLTALAFWVSQCVVWARGRVGNCSQLTNPIEGLFSG